MCNYVQQANKNYSLLFFSPFAFSDKKKKKSHTTKIPRQYNINNDMSRLNDELVRLNFEIRKVVHTNTIYII